MIIRCGSLFLKEDTDMLRNIEEPYTNDSSWDELEGVECDAGNCHYNKNGHICTADHIKVGTTSACCSADTLCDTFKPR